MVSVQSLWHFLYSFSVELLRQSTGRLTGGGGGGGGKRGLKKGGFFRVFLFFVYKKISPRYHGK